VFARRGKSGTARRGRRTQWGRDKRSLPASSVVPRVSDLRVAVGRALVVGTVLAWLTYFGTWLTDQFITGGHHTARLRVEAVVYLITVTLLTGSALSYLTCRLGFFYRAREHRRMPRAALEHFFARSGPSVTVLIPSYKEDERIIRTTVLSAALQDYPALRVVLLIDDPSNPTRRNDRLLLEQARSVAVSVQDLLDEPATRATAAMDVFALRGPQTPLELSDMAAAAAEYDAAAAWMRNLAETTEIVDHTDDFFVDQVLRKLATDFSVTAGALRDAAADGVVLPWSRLLELYQRLAWTFTAELSSFERKQYVSLSHEANKAMNLNSYIGLMGGSYRDVVTVSGRELVPARNGHGDLEIPDPDYVLTLDADSVLLPEYCLRLVHLMEQSEHADVAVAQTPYSAFPGSGTRLERIAGATTDLQYIAHQGMTYYGATFWVGANAVLRKRALNEIRESTFVGSWEIRRYIQDRTVIEDTESTIDMRAKGWTLLNYPERLAYSATPPDFGSLCIQRRRWANGGVLILPKLWRTRRARKARGEVNRISEAFIRVNYMASVAWSSISLLLLLAYPFDSQLISPLLGLIALPYFAGMASDLRYCGYKRIDVLRIYGFNLILMPVNLAGFLNSLVQALTGEKSVFGRTPKVANRTVPDFIFVISPWLLTGLAGWTLWQDWTYHRWINFGYAVLNTALALYAIVAFIGIRNSIADFLTHGKSWVSVPVEPRQKAQSKRARRLARRAAVEVQTAPAADWASILHFGNDPVASAAFSKAGAQRPVAAPALPAPRTPSNSTVRGRSGQRSADAEQPDFRTVFQPIVELGTGHVAGREALTRFDDGVAPHQRLAEESSRGGGLELEILLARASVQAAADFPSTEWLGLNVSLALVRAGRALRGIIERALRPVVLELDARALTDHAAALELQAALPEGALLSLAGVEPSYDCLKLVRDLRPEFIKLERGWVRELQNDPARQSLVRALVSLADEVGSQLIAEGVETDAELQTLSDLGVKLGQGYLLGRPKASAPVGV
jgi:EAL domain-containing protein (putative c-di-GMP-specific phosphodiesterase class I)/cellulose synthase/poly-beta-1,6-N-acetylglucosamine synthase-like glycosyltransferase